MIYVALHHKLAQKQQSQLFGIFKRCIYKGNLKKKILQRKFYNNKGNITKEISYFTAQKLQSLQDSCTLFEN